MLVCSFIFHKNIRVIFDLNTSILFSVILCLFSAAKVNASEVSPSPTNQFSIALAGDWDDFWGKPFSNNKKTLTRESMRETGKSDLIVLIGDLSYGRDDLPPKEQAKQWCQAAKK